MKRISLTFLTLGFALAFAASAKVQTNDPLPSWNDGAAKQSITQFVKDVSTAGGSRFVPPAQRIAVFDNDGTPVLVRLPEINFIDDKAGKPVGINQHIGRRPVAAFGNSDGDLQMLQWTTAGSGARFALLVHHTDAAREWAYDRKSSIGHLDKALDEAQAKGWTVVDMKRDWKRIFPFENR